MHAPSGYTAFIAVRNELLARKYDSLARMKLYNRNGDYRAASACRADAQVAVNELAMLDASVAIVQ